MVHQLNDYGHLLTIIPSIWMKYNHPNTILLHNSKYLNYTL